MPFGIFARTKKMELQCPVCGLALEYSIDKKELQSIELNTRGIAILDESDCPYCRHHFYTLLDEQRQIITQERDWSLKIEQLEDRLQTIHELLREEQKKPSEAKQRFMQLQVLAETTEKRIAEMEREFASHCKQWQERRQRAQI